MRRRPLLTTAVVVGASRSASRREAERIASQQEAALNTQARLQWEAQQRADRDRQIAEDAARAAVAAQGPQQQQQQQGYPQQGYPQQGYSPQGYAPQSYPPQGYPLQAYDGSPPQAGKPRFCSGCGCRMSEGARFCQECGTQG